MKIEYYETTMQSVTDYFVQGFKDTGRKVQKYESFVDQKTGKIMLRLYLNEEGE